MDFYEIYEKLVQTMGETQAQLLIKTMRQMYGELQQTVTKAEFADLKEVLRELAEAQKRTEQRLEELAQAQMRTEERLELLGDRVDSLTQRMEELAEAQRRTEERLEALSERVEGVSHSVGYSLKNAAYKALPAILAAQGISLKGRLVRRYIGAYQINIYGEGERAGQPLTLVGECKVRPSRKEIDRFLKWVEQLAEKGEIANPSLIFVAHDFPPPLEHYLAEGGILAVWSYEL